MQISRTILRDIPQMLEKMEKENYDVVCGWRYNRRDPFLKKVFSRFANHFRTSLTGETIHDSGCTLRIYKQEAVRDIELFGELHRISLPFSCGRDIKLER